MIFSVAKNSGGKVSIHKLSREIGVNDGDSMILFVDEIKKYGKVIIIRKLSQKDIDNFLVKGEI